MPTGHRFDCPSLTLDPPALLGVLRLPACCAFGLAVLFHLLLAQWRVLSDERVTPQPLTTQFVKRQPRLTKPLELKKRPQPRQRAVKREMVAVEARPDRTPAGSPFRAGAAARDLARPSVAVTRSAALDQSGAEPTVLAAAIEGARETRDAIDVSLEMVNTEALDTGRYQAMVIQDPTDKRNIRGYLHLVLVHVLGVTELARSNIIRTDQGIKRLIDSLNEMTDIKADVTVSADFASPAAMETPWIYVTSHKPFELTPAETAAIGKYVTHGGFLFCDEHIWVTYATYVSVPKAFRTMISQGCEMQGLIEGRDWSTGQVPSHHQLFHCFFDFDGPPIGYNFPLDQYPIYTREPLIGVFVKESLVAIITRRSYAAPWFGKNWSGPGDTAQLPTRRRALEFGVNTIIYALTREGSITSQVMDIIQ